MSDTAGPKKASKDAGQKKKKPSANQEARKAAQMKAAKPKVEHAKTDLIRRVTWDRVANKKKLPQFQTGDTIGVYVKVKEGEKERVQLFTGIVLKVQGSGIGRTFTVRKMASGVGVERTFPIMSPIIDRIELISRGRVRRSRLFYLRGLKGRSARLNTEIYFGTEGAPDAADEVSAEAANTPEAIAAAEAKVNAATEKRIAKAARQEKAKNAKK